MLVLLLKMKEVLYKRESCVYSNAEHEPMTYISYYEDSVDNSFQSITEKHPLFKVKETNKSEEFFNKNFGNPICSISKEYFIVLVEKYGDKVSLKIFYGGKSRRAGVYWFTESKNVEYVTVNVKTKDVYCGYIKDYQKIRKCKKKIQRNYFRNDPLNHLRLMIHNNMKQLNNDTSDNVATEAISRFMYEVDQRDEFQGITFSERLFRFYLKGRGIKIPNNFYVFIPVWYGPIIRQELKRNGNRMVDAVMSLHGISGKKIKKSLHNCKNLNIDAYKFGRDIFGDEWMNQSGDLILDCLNYSALNYTTMGINSSFLNYITTEELKRVFGIFKQVVSNQSLDYMTFYDHIRMYCELKSFGEVNLRWRSDDNKVFFREEHLDWADMLQQYKEGTYYRIYPESIYDKLSKEIICGNHVYYPVLLDDSPSYNEESYSQSNCVKTYIDRCSSVIVSVRKGCKSLGDRATIEYSVTNEDNIYNIQRVQSLGKFNNRLTEEWDDVLFKLDKRMTSLYNDTIISAMEIKKISKNGSVFISNVQWNDSGRLEWTNNMNIARN